MDIFFNRYEQGHIYEIEVKNDMEIYLDNSATTKPYPKVCESMVKAMREDYYNPSSVYRQGVLVEKKIEEHRTYIANTLKCSSKEILFTSGGTESINTAIFSVKNSKKKHIITSMIEHPATLQAMKKMEESGFDITYLKPLKSGCITADEVIKHMGEDTCLVSLMAVNNELGSKTDVVEIAKRVKEINSDTIIHVDAVQAYLKLKLFVNDGVIDFLSLSGHKIHGPKGIGVLYHRNGVKIPAHIVGGGQEGNFRSGTENVPGIFGIGTAVEEFYPNMDEKINYIEEMKNYLKSNLTEKISNIKVLSPQDSVCHILNVSFLGVRGEVLLHSLESEGICVSTGSACSSKKSGSHVLNALEFTKQEKEGAIRFSLSEYNTIEEMDVVVRALEKNVNMIRTIMKFGKGRHV